ncbi:uncharacterized protein LOC134768515 [Penaeus indicus]|uniref:uncharacterized protein LOC134768515 n=1 Tax=Penaeus indicus TaxID=29960 RepID=UPI00300C6552
MDSIKGAKSLNGKTKKKQDSRRPAIKAIKRPTVQIFNYGEARETSLGQEQESRWTIKGVSEALGRHTPSLQPLLENHFLDPKFWHENGEIGHDSDEEFPAAIPHTDFDMAGGRARSPSGLLLRLSLLLVLLACSSSPASSSSLPALEAVSPRAEDGAQVALHLVKRQATGLASSEEAALLALLDLVPRADRRSAASMLDRLFTTLDLNEDGLIDSREFETVLRLVATMNRHPSFV